MLPLSRFGSLSVYVLAGVLAVTASSRQQSHTLWSPIVPWGVTLQSDRIYYDVGDTLADGLSGNLDPESPTFDIVRERLKRIAVVSERDLVDAIRGTANHERLCIEGAAAAAVGAVASRRLDLRGSRTVVVLSGANIDLSKWCGICARGT